MLFHKQFENFNPLPSHVPRQPFSFLPEIASRARSVLIGKSLPELIGIAGRINNEIEGFYQDEKDLAILKLKEDLADSPDEFCLFFEWDGGTRENGHWVFKEEMLDDLDVPTEENCNEVDAFKAIIEKRDEHFFLPAGAPMPEREEFAEGKYHELFATLALWMIADALDFAARTSKESLSIAGEYAIKAMEAVCYAEHLKEVEWLERLKNMEISAAKDPAAAEALRQQIAAEVADREKSRRSEQFQELNRIRHKDSHQARQAVLSEWDKDRSRFPSAEKAGEFFADWLEEKGLVKSITSRTVTRWIRVHAKDQGIRLR